MTDMDDHAIEEIIENLASKLYFHGHPINRQEASEELGLKVNLEPTPELETAIWDLYRLYEGEFKNLERFRPADELMLKAWPANANSQDLKTPELPTQIEHDISYAIIESRQLVSRYTARKRYLFLGLSGENQEPSIREDTISEGWDHSQVP